MFTIRVSSPHGVDADFTVRSAVLALDIVLRSQRAGLWWTAELAAPDGERRLTLDMLRRLATTSAADQAERDLVDQIEWQHEMQTAFALN